VADSVDVLIVGSGPGGVNSAAPLVEAGKRVLMLDFGTPARDAGKRSPRNAGAAADRWKALTGDVGDRRAFVEEHGGAPVGALSDASTSS
jgi:choline dehydrogenase-like flavoprotein